jgi:hypothetical protein
LNKHYDENQPTKLMQAGRLHDEMKSHMSLFALIVRGEFAEQTSSAMISIEQWHGIEPKMLSHGVKPGEYGIAH